MATKEIVKTFVWRCAKGHAHQSEENADHCDAKTAAVQARIATRNLITKETADAMFQLWRGDATIGQLVALPKCARGPGMTMAEIGRKFGKSGSSVKLVIYRRLRETPEWRAERAKQRSSDFHLRWL